MDEWQVVKGIAENLTTVVVLMLWVVTERKNHKDTLEFYRGKLQDTLDEIKSKQERP